MFPRVATAIVAGLLLGIFYASLFSFTNTTAIALLGLSFGLLTVAQIVRRHSHALLLTVLCMCAVVLGAARFDAGRITYDPMLEQSVGESISLQGRVRAEPDVREGSTRLTVDAAHINGATSSVRVLVIARAYTDVRYGDSIAVIGKLRKPEAFESGEGRSFNYPMFLAVRGITYEVSFADVQVTGHGGNPMVHAVLAIKTAYIAGLRSVLPEPYAGLAAGITAGDKRSVGSDLSDSFQRVSLVHILVLSGYNITVVLGFLMRGISRFSRGPQLVLVLAVISFFVVVSGGASSASRAGAMAFAAVFAKLYGRQFVALRILLAIVFVMVLLNPYLLVFDPGFQLSVLATLGLIVFSPHVAGKLQFVPERYGLREIASATIATQLTVLSLLLYQNGLLSLVALPANVLALLAVPFAMAFSAIAALAGFLLGTWGTLFALPAYVLLRYIVEVADTFASLPYAAVQIPAFGAYMFFAMYAGLIVLGVFLGRRTHES